MLRVFNNRHILRNSAKFNPFLSGAIPVVYLLNRIKNIRQSQQNYVICNLYQYILIRQHVSTLSRSHLQAAEL
jgi:hypothetical protein